MPRLHRASAHRSSALSPWLWRTARAAALALGAAGLLSCAAGPDAAQLAAACPALAGRTVAAQAIGLPSGAARVTQAQLVPAAAESVSSSAFSPALPEHCRLLGQIAPLDPAAQPIQFQLNLPTRWNGKALQYGGGGFNGVLITGLAPLRDAAPGDPLPLARGCGIL